MKDDIACWKFIVKRPTDTMKYKGNESNERETHEEMKHGKEQSVRAESYSC